MSDLINVGICLSDIPQIAIKAANNGKKYLNICVAERRTPDNFGNTHSVYISQSKEEREQKLDKVYIGQGKIWKSQIVDTTEQINNLPPAPKVDDLPF